MKVSLSQKRICSAILLSLIASLSHGQITKDDRGSRGYFRLGINQFGKDLNEQLSAYGSGSILANMREGAYGSEAGYVLEFGRNYYFYSPGILPFDARVGLDWTQLSATYNELDWSEAAAIDAADGYTVDASDALAISLASKLGPVISINPISQLVVDLRVQLSVTYFVNTTDYYAYQEDDWGDERYFSFLTDDEESEDEASVLSQLGELGKFGFKPNYGVTVRYGGIGLALDYSPGSFKTSYSSSEGNGEERFKNNLLQFKLSLTL